VTDSLANYDS